MKTIKIKNSSELEQYYDNSRHLIEIEGNLECDGDIIANYYLYAHGYIKAGSGIKAGWYQGRFGYRGR